jgi:hypothetical protein
MPLFVKVEDFDGEVIASYNDDKESLNSVIGFCYLNPTEIFVFKYVDLFDDTVFNSLQVKDLLLDLDWLRAKQKLFDTETMISLDRIADFCNLVLKEPHRYLIFYGD